MEQAYQRFLPNGPLLDFFWSWRFLVRSLLAIMSTPLPQARVFHAAATGFSGLVGSYDQDAERILRFHEAGIELFMLQYQPFEAEMRRFAAEVMPRVSRRL